MESFTPRFHGTDVTLPESQDRPIQYQLLMGRGEVRPFLKAYYNTVAALADRETYTFWEHFFHASPHKTHQEGWFLLRNPATRSAS